MGEGIILLLWKLLRLSQEDLLRAESLSASATARREVSRSKILRIFSRASDDAPSSEILMAWISSASDGRDDVVDDEDERRGFEDVVGGEKASPCDDDESWAEIWTEIRIWKKLRNSKLQIPNRTFTWGGTSVTRFGEFCNFCKKSKSLAIRVRVILLLGKI